MAPIQPQYDAHANDLGTTSNNHVNGIGSHFFPLLRLGEPDLGADEYVVPGTIKTVYLSLILGDAR